MRAAQHVLAPPWLRHASDGTRVGGTAQAGCAAGGTNMGCTPMFVIAGRGGRSRRADGAAHARPAVLVACRRRHAHGLHGGRPLVRRAPSASVVWGVRRLRRAGGTACARPAAIAMRRRRYTHGRTALAIRQRRPGRAARSSHCEHDAPDICPPRAVTSEHELLEKKVFNGTLKRPDSKSGGTGTSQALCWYIISAVRAISAHVRTRLHLNCGPLRVGACHYQGRCGPAGIWFAGR